MASVEILKPIKVRKPSTRRQCELVISALQALFQASRYAGPRPDAVLRALSRSALAEYKTAEPELRAAIERASAIHVLLPFEDPETTPRERCWQLCETERRQLEKAVRRMRKRRPGESDVEWLASVKTFRKVTMNENTLAVLKAELDKLMEPLPNIWEEGALER